MNYSTLFLNTKR
jgi:hypothetical protein